jgi:hypothetical protein
VLWCELPHGVLGGWLFGRGSSLHESVPGLPLDLLVDHHLLIDLQLQRDLQLLRGLRLLLGLLFSRDLVFSFSEPFREVGVQIFSASIRTELIKLPAMV